MFPQFERHRTGPGFKFEISRMRTEPALMWEPSGHGEDARKEATELMGDKQPGMGPRAFLAPVGRGQH